MPEIDAALTAWTNAWAGRIPGADFAMIWLSAVGVPLLVLVVALQWWVPPRDRATRHVLVAAGLSFFLGLGFNQVVLLFVQRVRPYDAHVTHLLIDRSADFSFPSDHATAGFATAATFLVHGLPRRGFVFLAFAVLPGISRVYVGTHYVGDVLGGVLSGILAAALVKAAYQDDTRVDRLITGIL